MTCLTPEQIELLARGTVEANDLEELRRHLAQCDECRHRLKNSRANEEVLGKLKQLPESAVLKAAYASPEPDRIDFPGGSGTATGSSQQASFPGYEIVRELHRGGQGVVYEAIQKSTKRKVAIKVLLHGAHASKSAKKRFEREIELVAQLRHPNIISIFHSGLTNEGLQFYVMDYLRGLPLHRYVRENRLTLEDTLQLFASVCKAVQYAHQRGVIHRDLKPSNIVVDVEGSPRILDFGLAKLLAGPVETIVSISQDVMGTLAYMSPEQVRGNPDEVDTRTDIYTLGVILYELLTGNHPYPVVGQMADTLRHIADTAPTPPSRNWTSDSGVTRRSTRRLRPGECPIDDEVQTIVVKALAKERERRYQSAGELARDIAHYLSGEPIEARSDSGWYVLRKQLRKYRTAAMVVAAFLLLLAVATTISTALYVQAERARGQSDRARAEAEAVTQFLTGVFASVEPGQARGREVTVKEVLDSSAGKIETAFADQPLVEATLRTVIGNTYRALGKYPSAELHLRTAVKIRRRELGSEHSDVADTLTGLAAVLMDRGEYESAELFLQEALDIRRRLHGAEHPTVIQALNDIGVARYKLGDYLSAESLWREVLAVRRRQLGNDHPLVAESLHNLAAFLRLRGDYDAAEPLVREALTIRRKCLGEDDPKVAASLNNLGNLLKAKHDYEGAESVLLEALAIRRTLYGEEHAKIAQALKNLAGVMMDKGDYSRAESLVQEAIAIYRKVHGEAHPELARALNTLAMVYIRQGEYASAEKPIREAISMQREMVGEDHTDLAYFLDTLGQVLMGRGDAEAAEPVLLEALEILRKGLPSNHQMITRLESLLIRCLTTLGRYEDAELLVVSRGAEISLAPGVSDKYAVERLRGIIDLYEAWGRLEKAAEYRAMLPNSDNPSGSKELPPNAPDSSEKGGGGQRTSERS